ncbi:hypothetical protein HPB47_003925 [Ixodes persulcatus]|uniref:Uncharacterized protein n=1 Tax=Ixodes persulcatus TaxID=34615 RepID=A0AC60PI36_IXOPE|nr:hypothetical protein HPB47_003925 [Ixodes persulcatus]
MLRARAVTYSNCHNIGYMLGICPEPQVRSTCGKPHEETMDDEGNVTCPSPLPFCQLCRKNGQMATNKYCPRRLHIVRKIPEMARRHATPPGSQDNRELFRQVYHKKRGGGQQPAPQLITPTTITINPAMLLHHFTAIAPRWALPCRATLALQHGSIRYSVEVPRFAATCIRTKSEASKHTTGIPRRLFTAGSLPHHRQADRQQILRESLNTVRSGGIVRKP